MSDPNTIAVYDDRAAYYDENFSSDTPSSTLAAFITRLPERARVLDMGCGPGSSARHLRDAGHHPDPVDASAAMVEIARDRYGLPARHGDFYALEGPYDAVWANFSFLHMPRTDLAGYFHLLHEAMRPGALLHIGLKTGTDEQRDDIGRLYSYFTPEEVTEWLRAARFAPEEPRTGVEKGMAGTDDAFFTLTAIRAPGND